MGSWFIPQGARPTKGNDVTRADVSSVICSVSYRLILLRSARSDPMFHTLTDLSTDAARK